MRSRLAAVLGLVLLPACGGAPRSTDAPTPSEASQAGVDVLQEPVGAVSARQPRSVVLIARLTNVRRSIDTLQRVGKLPMSLDELIAKESDGKLAQVDLTQPMDVVVALDPATADLDDPKFFLGFSVPLTKDYKTALDFLTSQGWEVRPNGSSGYTLRDGGADELECELATEGPHTPRVACADSQAAFRELGPWMLRTLPNQPSAPVDAWTRIDFAPFQERLMPQVRSSLDELIGEAREGLDDANVRDPELLDAPSVMARETTMFLDEFEHFQATLSLDPGTYEGRFGAELFFKGNASWVTQVLTGKNGPPGPTPDAFWRLPKDASSALFGRSVDPALFTGARRLAKKGAIFGLQLAPIPEPDKQALLALLDALPTAGGIWASAGGELSTLAGGASKERPETMTPAQAIVETRNFARATLGWAVVSEEGDPAQVIAFLKQGADVYARGARLAREHADEELKNAPPDMRDHFKKSRAELEALLPKVKLTENPPGFPKGSAIVDVDVSFSSSDVWSLVHPVKDWDKRPEHPKTPEARGNVVVRLAVVPDDVGRYLLGYSADGDVLKQKMLGSLKGAKPDQTLAARSDLSRLRVPMQGGGFFGLGQRIRRPDSLDSLGDADAKKLRSLLDGLPHKGLSPAFMSYGGAGGPAPTFAFEFVVERPWIEDVAALTLGLIQASEPKASTSSAPISVGASSTRIGVTECDDFIVAYRTCIDKMPEAAKDPARQGLAAMTEEWRKAAAKGGPGKDTLPAGCKAARGAIAAYPACK